MPGVVIYKKRESEYERDEQRETFRVDPSIKNWPGLVWPDPVWPDLVWPDLVWPDLTRPGLDGWLRWIFRVFPDLVIK